MALPVLLKPKIVNRQLIKISTTDGKIIDLEIYPESSDPMSIKIINKNEAAEFGEAEFQLKEECSYEYQLPPQYYLGGDSRIVKPSKRSPHSGRITTGIFVGSLKLDVFEYKTSRKIAETLLEVRSKKTKYRTDYRNMLEYITHKCTDLLMRYTSPVTQSFETDFNQGAQTLYQRFSFIRSILSTEEFRNSIHRIIHSPATAWLNDNRESDIKSIKRVDRSVLKQFAFKKNRIKVSGEHPLSSEMASVPSRIIISEKKDTPDTPENRFVKHALQEFNHFCKRLRKRFLSDSRAYKEALYLENMLDEFLGHDIFKEISSPVTLPLNSPVLQRKEGYRQVLRVWLIFDLAAKLIWHGGEDVYNAGKRDVAVLYEYWLFFRLLELLQEIYSINPESIGNLIEKTSDGLGLKLKSGNYLPLKGIYDKEGRSLNIEFSYNRTFSGKSDYPKEGSWARSLRPDYTLTLWPSDFAQPVAEEQELIVHIHFDSKYKIEKLAEIIGKDDEDLSSEKEEQRTGTYKRADLLKMHAYKDAIRRTGGAYVLYPGDDAAAKMKGFHEIIPGLGAFCVRPNKTDDGTAELKSFIIEVTQHLLNKASQRDRLTYHTFDILKSKGDDKIFDKTPEIYEGKRVPHPAETFVLIGYSKDEDHYKWIEKNGLYNFRMNSVRGSLRINPGVAVADYLLLHTKDNLTTGDIWQILERGPRIFSKEELINSGYPSPSVDNYLIYKIKRIDTDEFANAEWDLRMLKGFTSGRASPIPFTVSLVELMKTKVIKDKN